MRVDAQLQRNYPTQNLAAVVRGTIRPDSFLIVSAHYDHLGMMGPHVYFPGANDNASGVALLLELAAHYAKPENRPAYSVVFLLFGAEEAGLVGSRLLRGAPAGAASKASSSCSISTCWAPASRALPSSMAENIFEAPYRRLVHRPERRPPLPACLGCPRPCRQLRPLPVF